MQFETNVYRGCLLQLSTNIDATSEEADLLDNLVRRLGQQLVSSVAEAGGQLLPTGFAFPPGAELTKPVTLELDERDVNALAACCARITWPRSRMSVEQRAELKSMRDDLAAWQDEIEAEAMLQKLTPEQRERLAQKAAK